ncbi:hypothetical protein [Nostoc sp.]|uniref:hypothetical protein n=1 Tax=Nostoc sp. TaxID=1180 RepID=UPI002FF67838
MYTYFCSLPTPHRIIKGGEAPKSMMLLAILIAVKHLSLIENSADVTKQPHLNFAPSILFCLTDDRPKTRTTVVE